MATKRKPAAKAKSKAKAPAKKKPAAAEKTKPAGRKAAVRKKAVAKRERPAPPAEAAAPAPAQKAFPIEIDPRQIEASIQKIRDELVHWANKGRYTRVRFRFRGRQLLPDLPLAAVIAAEGLTFYWAGILRALLVHVAGGALIDVELVNDSEKKVQEGKEALLSGDADRALELFERAVQMERDNANAHLHIGVALKLKGDRAGARAALEKAKALDPKGAVGAEAERILATLPPPPAQVTISVVGTGDPLG